MGRRLYNGVRLLGSGPCLPNVEKIDLGAMPYLSYCTQRGMQVDLSHFERLGVELGRDMDRITEQVRSITGVACNLDSGDQVSKLLFKTLGLKQARPKMTTSGKRESVEDEVLTQIQHEHEVIPLIQSFKEYSKLKGTYVDPMPRLARRTTFGQWRMFPNLGVGRVPSGRLNCKEPNLLAMPSRTDRGRQIRDGFITDPGWTFLSVDESQIEVRVCAHASEDANLIRVYENGEDVYGDFAIAAFGLPDRRYKDMDTHSWVYPGVDKLEHRYPSKTCFLAAIYDVSAGGLLEQMPVICANCHKPAASDKPGAPVHDCGKFASLWTEAKCQDILNALYLRYPGILTDRRRNHSRARQKGYIWDMWGRLLHVAAVRSVLVWVVSAALREVGNFPYQSGAQGTIKLTMAEVWDGLVGTKMLNPLNVFDSRSIVHPVLQIHDELLLEAREDEAEGLGEYIVSVFEGCADLRVPIQAGACTSSLWGSLPK